MPDRSKRDGPDGLDAARLEGMLEGDLPWPPGLAELRAAARAPGRRDELAGEAAAVAAFHAAHAGAAPKAGRALGRLLAATVAAVTVLAGGGLAVAAATGRLSPPARTPAQPAPGATAPGGRAVPPVATPPVTSPPAASSADTAPAADTDLCRRYRSLAPGDREQALKTAPLLVLADRAGGRSRVPAYCDALATVTPAPTGPGNGKNLHPDKPSKSPKGSKSPKDTASPPGIAATGSGASSAAGSGASSVDAPGRGPQRRPVATGAPGGRTVHHPAG